MIPELSTDGSPVALGSTGTHEALDDEVIPLCALHIDILGMR
jgi:hypothetical protein